MKELSVEQKAALYDDVIERAKSYLNDCPDRVDAKGCIEYLLPSLKESEYESLTYSHG